MSELNKLLGNFSKASMCTYRFQLIVVLLLVFVIPSLAQEPATVPRELKEETLAGLELGGEPQVYQMDLQSDHYVDLLIIKGDLNLTATVFAPKGDLIGEFTSVRYEPLRVAFISTQIGRHRLEIRSLEKKDPAARYNLKVTAKRPATADDRKVAVALRALADAAKLRTDWREPSLREAISKYVEASKRWQSAGRPANAAAALENTGDIYFTLSDNRQALSYYLQALDAGRSLRDRLRDTRTLNKVGYVHVYLGQGKKALEYATRALKYYATANTQDNEVQRGEAEARNSAGEALYSLGSPRKAIDYFNDALTLCKRVGDRSGAALAHINLGYSYLDLGELQQARQHIAEARSLYEETGERRGQAQALTAIGSVHAFLGEKQKALDSQAEAFKVFRAIGDREGQAVALNSIANAYEDLNEPQTALDNYNRALQIYQERGHRDFEAVTRYYLGRVYESLGDERRALEFYEQSMLQSRRSGQQRVTAYALSAISAIRSSAGNKQKALQQLNQVLRLYRRLGDRRGQVDTLNKIGQIYFAMGHTQRALVYYRQALPLSQAASDRMLEASTFYHLARAKKNKGALNDALADTQESLRTIESLRAQIISSELRASYFASMHKHSELYIDLLMRLHKLHPDQGFSTLALQASENARARALLEILGETSVRIRQGVDANLLERERSLQLQLSAKAAYQMRIRGGNGDAEEIARVDGEIRALKIAYQEVQTLIKQQSPGYATLVQPQPLPIADIQAELGGPDTLLLEYALGEEKSYVWALTSNSLAGYELPARSTIEQAARNVYNLLTARQSIGASANYQESLVAADSQYWKEAASLSQMLLGPVVAELGNKRLLIVADGALQYLPFEALPAPVLMPQIDNPTPLVLDHEIVNLPSASTLAAIRRGEIKVGSAAKLVVVMADPVFARDDPRLSATHSFTASAMAQSMAADAPRVVGTSFSRLPGTRQEAEAIMAITPAGKGTMVTDFNACRSNAISGRLGRHRIVHLATHGIIDTEHPELSGIMLSMLNSAGESQDGFLQLHDVYNLDLSGTYLVVLSACRTGLGKDVKGEGLVGLTRGFMYAGARSVVASLWKVDDRATAALMKYFYKAMLVEGLPPAAALRKAKQSMWQQERWHAPYFWAAFVLQGEYLDAIVVEPKSRVQNYIPIAMTVSSTLIGVLHGLRRLRRNKLGRS